MYDKNDRKKKRRWSKEIEKPYKKPGEEILMILNLIRRDSDNGEERRCYR